jgi:biopolymer transport protein ExbD
VRVDLSAKKTRIEIVPLIDVIFLLLVFFIYAMMSMAFHYGLPVDLPKASQGVIERGDLPSITLTKDGLIFLNDLRISKKELSTELRKLTVSTSDGGVLLFADQEVPYREVFEVVEKITKAGIANISLQSRLEKER